MNLYQRYQYKKNLEVLKLETEIAFYKQQLCSRPAKRSSLSIINDALLFAAIIVLLAVIYYKFRKQL